MSNRKSIRHIIKKYLKRKTTGAEEQQLFSFYEHIENRQTKWEEDKHGNKNTVELRILENIYDRIESKQQMKKKNRPLFTPWKTVAAIVLLCAAAFLIWNRYPIKEGDKTGVATIQPGSDKALLQLADGRTVYLDSSAMGELAVTSGMAIRMAKKGALVYTDSGNTDGQGGMNTITVPKGGQFKVTLADGTSVWLNASSSLTYPTRFSGSERRVKLVGEAYFDVSKRVQKGATAGIPFIVETNEQVVEVLGTAFNINAYSDEQSVRTTLITGAVKVTPNEGAAPKLLKPGEQSILADGHLAVRQVNTNQSVAWRQGDFTFDDMPLEEIMRQLERWYDVEVSYQGDAGKIEFGGSISRSKEIQEVLDVLALTGVEFTIKGRRIMVTP